MNREELAQRALVLRGLRELVNREEAQIRQEMAEAFTKPGQREVGELNGHPLGAVQLIKGSSSWTVTDSAAWLAWVEKHQPDEIVHTVRSSYTAAVIAKLKSGPMFDEATGEVIVPDGIAPTFSDPSIRVTATKDAAQVVLEALGEVAVVLGFAVAGELE